MSAITSHILDVSRGRPAANVGVRLDVEVDGEWQQIGDGTTDDDGRVNELLPEHHDLVAGNYRIVFESGDYFAGQDIDSFYPRVEVNFRVGAAREHFHVPLLLSPHGYSTYRGS
ncbi:MAG: hydroxyisourate hydrolase [Acidobacteria bacterium]|nr:hydroxyisourate hydrolase [Acidobacteriota bacterium]